MSRAIVFTLLTFLAAAQPLSACSIPVFRFALERWAPDLFEVSVFHRCPLSDSDEQRVTRVEDQAVSNGGHLNLEVIRCNLDEDVPADLLDVWKSLKSPSLPTVVVRTPRKATGQSIVWQGSLSDPFLDGLAVSPTRREITRRLSQGDSVVWLFVRGTDAEQADRVRKSLDTAIKQAEDQIELPAGIGRPGSELLSRVPLQLRFSVVELSADSREEHVLLKLLRSALPQPPREEESLLAPIFGRGRVLSVQSARDVEPEVITDLTTYLCSACSCQVKQQNPGFDLLCEMNWEESLFEVAFDRLQVNADDSSETVIESVTDSAPTLVAIPPGEIAGRLDASPAPPDSPPTGIRLGFLLVFAALAVTVSMIVFMKW